MTRLSFLLVGDTNRAEFRAARDCLDACGAVHQVADVDEAAELLAGEFLPGVIVVVQAFPGQFSHQAIDRLRRLAPLARVLGMLGSWCEGEVRTGTPWPAAIRTYWHQWANRCRRELYRLAEGQRSSWTLPVTATEEERLLADASSQWPRHQELIVIDTPSAEMHAWLSAACRSRGFSTVWRRRTESARTEGAGAALFDRRCLSAVGDGVDNEEASLRRLVEEMRPMPVAALLDFPRIADFRCALAAGAATVLSKPVAVEDLFWTLDVMCVRGSPD